MDNKKWKQLHDDLQNNKYAGTYGGDNISYHALTEALTKIDLNLYQKYNETEIINPQLLSLLNDKQTRRLWDNIITFDPLGLISNRPSIAAVQAKLDFKEARINIDGDIVDNDGMINVLKIAIEQIWNIRGISKRLGIPENKLRSKLFKYHHDIRLLNENINAFIPPIGGISLFCFGDISRLKDPETIVTVRVHDSCLNSDCFRGTICTCAPYLIYSIEKCVETAQNGGVGIIAYFRKEGRALGEVIKFRVYNERNNQEGGDVPEKYFQHTKNIAGVTDARHQKLMPDFLLWLGIKKIDNLVSMSNDKYEALTYLGIKVINRIDLPNDLIPNDALVEINAKISSGYFSKGKQILETIKNQSSKVFDYVLDNKSKYFRLNFNKVDDVFNYINQKLKNENIKINHSRLNHFENIDGLDFNSLFDLIVISSITDAGAGKKWKYEYDNKIYKKSEGLAKAFQIMFNKGLFSDTEEKNQVTSNGIEKLDYLTFLSELQLHQNNSNEWLIHPENRFKIIKNLGLTLEKHKIKRPCEILGINLDILKNINSNTRNLITNKINMATNNLICFIINIFPQPDVYYHSDLNEYIPFHKLALWTLYSLYDLFSKFNIIIKDELDIGLSEYRNAGFFYDIGLIEIKNHEYLKYNDPIKMNTDFVIELRALTIHLLSKLREMFPSLTMSQLLECGTWKGGRELANLYRNGDPPFNIELNGMHI
jgi:GTP cyclohydrolase II